MRYIEKKSIAEIPEINGSVVDTRNVADKTSNALSIAQLEKENTFSEQEKLTGQYWIGGKPIYRKTVKCKGLINTGGTETDHDINNMGILVRTYGYASNGNDTIPLPYAHTYPVAIYVTKTAIGLVTYSDRSSFTEVYVTIEYTKTTD